MVRTKGSKNINLTGINKICNFCCWEFYVPHGLKDRKKFCSKSCKISYGHNSVTRKILSDSQKGKPAWNKGKVMPSLRIPRKNGGKHIDKDGYIRVYCPNHPSVINKRRKDVLEHRLIMEQKIGRYLTKEEVVHHKNEVRTDNHPDNLMLFPNNVEHLRYHNIYSTERLSKIGRMGAIKKHQAIIAAPAMLPAAPIS